MLVSQKKEDKRREKTSEEKKTRIRNDELPEVCHKSPVHMDWCLALYRGKPLPATPPPQDMLPLLVQLMMRDENLARLIRLKFPKIFRRLEPTLKKARMRPSGPKKVAKKTLRKGSREAKEALRKIKKEIKKMLAEEKKVAKEMLREKRATALTTLSPGTKRYVSNTLRRVRAHVG